MGLVVVGRKGKVALAAAGLISAVLQAGTAQATPFISGGTLLVSGSTYDNSQGAVASLGVGTTLAGSATTTSKAVAGNDYTTVWNNSTPDSSFGVTSPIFLQNLNTSGTVLNALTIPTSQVVTSFPSKSELGLNISPDGKSVSFMGYAGAGVGALDVSNSDAVVGQDPTNPVTHAFGSNYAFARTIVTVNADGTINYTPTVNYGGNNGRSALLGPNGLYYTAGNANNGNAATFGPGNGTNPDVTKTTGIEVVSPINGATASVAIPANNSAEINPLLQDTFPGKAPDKPGKDDNFRGLTEYNGALYFTKGSGSNGIDTVYTASNPGGALPTVATAASSTISILPGFPTDSAKATGGDFTPFGIFFVNPTTIYVADEGSGDSTDASSHAGLGKWSYVCNGLLCSWQLDYTLRNGLIGTTYTLANAFGNDPYATVTTAGLRNITGSINADGTVTIWGVTSTLSSSGDNGADPNEVVMITDLISATSLPLAESFSVFEGPQYGTVFRGVAFATTPETSTIFLFVAGFSGLTILRRRSSKSDCRAPSPRQAA